jgi:hypothetical protein
MRRNSSSLRVLTVASFAWVFTVHAGASGQAERQAPRATPLEPKTAILEAFRDHRLVGIGDAHGNRLGEAFQLSVLRDPRLPSVVQDIVLESGNSRHQAVADRYIRGEDVPREALQRIWLDTTQQHVASLDIPPLFAAVREVNASLPAERRLRVLLAEPPIDWDQLKTQDELRAWEADPAFDRDVFGAALVQREVLAKNRRALLLYGAAHLFRRVRSQSVVTVLEKETRVFTVWTNAGTELSALQPDVATWPAPSLTKVRGTMLGSVGLATYLGPNAGDVSPEWLAPMQDQFDAVLYLGPQTTITFDRPKPWRCSEPAFAERLRRIELRRPGMGARIKAQCVPD